MNVLITGCASGIGKKTMEYFLYNNHFVYAIDKFEIDKHDNLVSFLVDITNEAELNKVFAELCSKDVKLDAIINIAGIHKMASLVENDFNDLKKLMEINVLGTMLINNVFHPLLNKNGKIIIVTSEVAVFDPLPFNGLYSISKSTLEVYAQALRQELNLINQRVVTIRPGAIQTPLSNNSLNDIKKLANDTVLYKRQAHHFLSISKKFMGKPIKPIKVAKLIYKSATKKKPKLSYSIHSNIGLVLLNILPKRLQCFIIKKLLNKKIKEKKNEN